MGRGSTARVSRGSAGWTGVLVLLRIRFGGVKLRFIPAGMSEEALNALAPRATPATERQRGAAATADPRQTATAPQGGTSKLLWALLALLVAAAAFFVLRGRA